MDSLFKFIFYLIIIVVWSLNNIKKLEKKQDDLPSLPKRPAEPAKRPVQPSFALPPQRESIFADNTRILTPDPSIISFDDYRQIRKEKAMSIRAAKIKKAPAPEPVENFEENTPEADLFAKTKQLKEIKKPSLGLKSNLKQGIIWSIILGPPRSRAPFNTKGFPIQI